VIELEAARDRLREELDEPIEIQDPDVLDAAAAVVIGSRQSESPRGHHSSRATATTTARRNSLGSDYPDSATIAS
jgi:hypothetical protein